MVKARRARSFLGVLLCGAAAWLGGPYAARASVVEAMDEPQLIGYSNAIFFGTVLETTVRQPQPNVLLTRAVVQVYHGVLGVRAGETISVDSLGGTAPDGVRWVASGAPTPQPGDMVVGFVYRQGDAYRAVGMAYGWLPVAQVSGALTVSRSVEGMHLVAPGGGPADPKVAELRAVPLREFLDRIGNLVRVLRPTEHVHDDPWQGPTIRGGGP